MEASTGTVQLVQHLADQPNPAATQQTAVQQPSKKPTKKRIRIQTEKRKEQNRSNQRAFRQRRERYVKDLEVSHHNLRHLVSHQGGEIESLKARLVDLSGGKEGADPSPTAKAAALARQPFEFETEYGSGSEEHYSVKSESSDIGADELHSKACPSEKPASSVESRLTGMQPLIPEAPPALPTLKPAAQPPSGLQIMAPVPMPSISTNVQQYWTTPELQPSMLSSSSTTVSSMGSSWSQDYTPPTPTSSTFDPTGQFQPFLTAETAAAVPRSDWQSDASGNVKDSSNWLQQSNQPAQFCLPYQEANYAPSSTAYDLKDDSMDVSTNASWQMPNALELDNLFPNFSTSGKKPFLASPLQLLGRPLTPFASFVSPSADYGYTM